MAREVHGYIKTVLIIGAIVFAGGGYAMQISSNTKQTVKNAIDIEDVEDTVQVIQLSAKDTQILAVKAAEAQRESVKMFEIIMKQNEERAKADATANTAMQIDIAKIQVQVSTLIKDSEE
jgi:hypothetical protein